MCSKCMLALTTYRRSSRGEFYKLILKFDKINDEKNNEIENILVGNKLFEKMFYSLIIVTLTDNILLKYNFNFIITTLKTLLL